MDFAGVMALEPHGPDTFVGVGPRYPWGGLYGGQIVAQGLRAATLTVDPTYRVHSLHAYFIRRGDDQAPIRYEVDRLRDGRSFVTRAVVARQAVGAILSMSASFQVPEEAAEVQTSQPPEVPSPDALGDGESWSEMFERRMIAGHGGPIDLGPGRAAGWLRMRQPAGGPDVDACALAYLSDDIPTDAVVAQHPERNNVDIESGAWMSASLDHAIWFHRPIASDAWHLHDFTCHGLLNSRGVAVGHVFTAAGAHVATIAQEVLLRRRPA